MPEQPYEIEIKKKRLVFRTNSFKAEDVSALHGGIYNRELTSSLASGALTLLVFMLLYFAGVNMGFVFIVLAIALFVFFFVLLRTCVFFESHLRLAIDKAKGRVEVFIKRFRQKRWAFSVKELEAISKGFTVIAPENPDGIRVVREISIQHGQVIPGLGEVKQYHTVNLELKNGTGIIVFSTYHPSEAEDVLRTLRNFIGMEVA